MAVITSRSAAMMASKVAGRNIAGVSRARATYSTFATFQVPAIKNEVNQTYAKGTAQRAKLTAALDSLSSQLPLKIPAVIAGRHLTSATSRTQPNPADLANPVAQYSTATPADVTTAIDSALAARESWASLPFADRAAVFLKAADLISTKYRYELMASVMLGQGKNAWQAEIDIAAELADFFRFNVQYAAELYAQQPKHNSTGVWNRVEYRPLEGFVYAVTPFNFTAIAGNLPGAPALMGNVVVWKPSAAAILSNWLVYKVLLEAGLPPNVIQFVPGNAVEITKTVLARREFAALHFTGSTGVFRELYGEIGQGVAEGRYLSYPRIVGETGGKNFHLVHPSADLDNAVIQTVRGAFEYQGQKCSATSRAYIPKSVWPEFKEKLIAHTKAIKQGDPRSPENFVGPVIHSGSFDKLARVIEEAKSDSELTLLTGGTYDKSKGFFIQPTIYEAKSPNHKLMGTELFGPILTVYVWDDAAPNAYAEICKTVNSTGEYALTGSVFAADRHAVRFAEENLRDAAGNFYINCKSTGAVVGQQPFGGARASGTNDKAGAASLLTRFVSMRSIKEEFTPTTEVTYPSNEI